MAVSHDNSAVIVTQSVHPGSGSSGTLTVGSGSNRCAAVGILNAHNLGGGAEINITAVTVGTDSLSLISGSKVSDSFFQGEVWGGALTVTGSQTVTITWTGAEDDVFEAYAVQCSGCDLVNNGNGATNTGSPISLAMTSTAGDLTFTWHANDGTGNPTTTQTRIHTVTTIDPYAADRGDASTNPTHQWTTGGVNWGHGLVTGVNFRAASSDTSTTEQRMAAIAAHIASGGMYGRVWR